MIALTTEFDFLKFNDLEAAKERGLRALLNGENPEDCIIEDLTTGDMYTVAMTYEWVKD